MFNYPLKIKTIAQYAGSMAILLIISVRLWQAGQATINVWQQKQLSLKTFFKVDQEKIIQGAQFKTLNRMMPDLSKLKSIASNAGQGRESELQDFINYYQLIILYYPQMPEGYGMLGYCYYLAGRIPEAADAWQKAAFINPDYFYYWYNLGVVSLHLGRPDQAKMFLAKAITTKPDVTLHFLFSSFIYHQLLLTEQSDSPENSAQKLFSLYQRCLAILQIKSGQPPPAVLEAELF